MDEKEVEEEDEDGRERKKGKEQNNKKGIILKKNYSNRNGHVDQCPKFALCSSVWL